MPKCETISTIWASKQTATKKVKYFQMQEKGMWMYSMFMFVCTVYYKQRVYTPEEHKAVFPVHASTYSCERKNVVLLPSYRFFYLTVYFLCIKMPCYYIYMPALLSFIGLLFLFTFAHNSTRKKTNGLYACYKYRNRVIPTLLLYFYFYFSLNEIWNRCQDI